MQLKPEQERVSSLLKETITLMCKNGLKFETKFTIDAVIGVTLDEKEVFLISVNEIFRTKKESAVSDEDSSNVSGVEMGSISRRKKRKRNRLVKRELGSDGESGHEQDNDRPDAQSESLNRDSNDDNSIMFIKEEPHATSWPTSSCSFQDPNAGEQSELNFSPYPGADVSHDATDLKFADTSFPSSVGQSMMNRSCPRQQPSVYLSPSGNHTTMSQMGGDHSQGANQMQNRGRRFSCHMCSKTYSSKSGLHLHLRWHRGDYLHHCTMCGKGFMSTINLKGHMSWHTGQKDFKCERCNKEFRYKYDLSEHLQFCKDGV